MKKNFMMFYIAHAALFLIGILENAIHFFKRAKGHPKLKAQVAAFSFLSLFLFGGGFPFLQDILNKEQTVIKYDNYVVERGDSLFSIAKDYYTGDLRKGVSWIRKVNNMERSVIYAGEILRIPYEVVISNQTVSAGEQQKQAE
ncbi:LysM peptidoglycan-binding domain-containing protein [Paenibacillus sp. FSL K6-2859]|uniref:LysM peptidoglycan-binding domain-containing protein n=1 Tax=Paenibacillus sp. FSL K6-2859 TaxID=2921482 RepID=UPI0030F8F097